MGCTPASVDGFMSDGHLCTVNCRKCAWALCHGCLLVGLGIGMTIPDVQLDVAFALCVVVIGFAMQALSEDGKHRELSCARQNLASDCFRLITL